MDAMQQQAMAQAEERRRNAERTRITAALARLDEGEWGYCGTCGEEIAEGRLRNDPSVVQCLRMRLRPRLTRIRNRANSPSAGNGT